MLGVDSREDFGPEGVAAHLLEKVAEWKALRKQVRQAMKELPSRVRPNRYKRPALINLTDEDARLMKSRQGVVPGYNAKAVVSPLATDKGISSMLVTPRMWWISSMTPPALSDAAHIIPDSEPEGKMVVRNGISLWRLHHAAFDRYFLAMRAHHTIEVRADILEESDGPTLRPPFKDSTTHR